MKRSCCLGFVRPCADVSDVYLKELFSNETFESAAPVSHIPNIKSLEFRCRDGPTGAKAQSFSFGFLF